MTREEHKNIFTKIAIKMGHVPSQALLDKHWKDMGVVGRSIRVEVFEKVMMEQWDSFGYDLFNQQKASRN